MPRKKRSAIAIDPAVRQRPYQTEFFWSELGVCAALWRRQAGKSRTLGGWGLKEMMELKGCSVFYVSAAILLGVENIRKEAELWIEIMVTLRQIAASQGRMLTSNGDDLDLDAVADLFEHSKLETRLWHDGTTYSRSRVVAPNPDTAVGWTGHIVLDEVGRIPNFKDVLEAVEPFMASNRQFKMRLATTPPPDDDHFSWELLCPPGGDFPINPSGNWYTTESGLQVHRVDVFDAFACGVPMFDKETRQPVEPAASRARAFDKQAWDRNYALHFIRGGAAACGLPQLLNAMAKGKGITAAHNCTEEIAA